MKENKVPVIEGSDSLDTPDEALKFAKEIGFPVIIKAAEGGGGKGMRIVEKERNFLKAYDSAKAESKAAFNSERVFVEKYIKKPKHIEFQILADQHGNVVHFGERDCSIQRRHQKLIEEAPSPALTEKLRKQMGEVAVKAAMAVKYEGVGTVEFLLDKDNKFYFMEMNTRIQVEHGVTEFITGVDLVKEQILVAAGAHIAHVQDEIKINGWAIECRINAEDPIEDFKPTPGKIDRYIVPGGPGVRICSCAHSGFEITPYYDSMISKLITLGQRRGEAIDRMKRALDEYEITGVKTTIPFHKEVINNRQFRKGNITTDFIQKNKIMEKMGRKIEKNLRKDLDSKKVVAIIGAAIKMYESKKVRHAPIHQDRTDNWVLVSRMENVNNISDNEVF
jgi:acetyl-CoA carboxylase biotin carboxylase subunit